MITSIPSTAHFSTSSFSIFSVLLKINRIDETITETQLLSLQDKHRFWNRKILFLYAKVLRFVFSNDTKIIESCWVKQNVDKTFDEVNSEQDEDFARYGKSTLSDADLYMSVSYMKSLSWHGKFIVIYNRFFNKSIIN